MFPDHLYACLKRDEVWHVHRSRHELRELRKETGHAFTFTRAGAVDIQACDDFQQRFTDRFAPPAEVLQRLRDHWNDDGAQLRERIRLEDGRVRILSTIRYVENDERHDILQTTVVTIVARSGNRTLSITTDSSNLSRHLQLIAPLTPNPSPRRGEGYRRYPMVWRNGSGAVLLHEAIGHPAEQSLFAQWPPWLNVKDDPSIGPAAIPVDDVGDVPASRALTSGEAPAAFRREDFRSLPLRRMTNLVVRSSSPHMDLPDPRIEVFLLRGGAYDSLQDSVRLSIAHALLTGDGVTQSFEPFEFEERRIEISRRLMGAAGEALPYPGVICADEGQRLPVGTISPDLLTAAFS